MASKGIVSTTRRRVLKGLAVTALAAPAVWPRPAHAADKVRVITNWRAEPEHGGFYQAKATGIYEKAGLDVDIRPGGPQINGMQLLAANSTDVIMGNGIRVLNAVEEGLPVVAVGASYQVDLQCIVTHSDVTSLEGLKDRKVFVTATGRTGYWPWLREKYGLSDEQIRPYASMQPFLADKMSALGGLISGEPFEVRKVLPGANAFLLAEHGFPPYGAPMVVMRPYLDKNRDVVARFVKATQEGWKSFLADPAPTMAAVKVANPDQPDDLSAYAFDVMKKMKVIDGGDAAKMGIGIMTEERWRQTAEVMHKTGLLKDMSTWQKGFTVDFVKDLKIMPA